MVWMSSHMSAGKRRTLGATIVTIFSHMTRDVSVFVKCDTIFASDKSGGKCVCPRLSVCLSVTKITKKREHGFG